MMIIIIIVIIIRIQDRILFQWEGDGLESPSFVSRCEEAVSLFSKMTFGTFRLFYNAYKFLFFYR
jgi:hypothetical protein